MKNKDWKNITLNRRNRKKLNWLELNVELIKIIGYLKLCNNNLRKLIMRWLSKKEHFLLLEKIYKKKRHFLLKRNSTWQSNKANRREKC